MRGRAFVRYSVESRASGGRRECRELPRREDVRLLLLHWLSGEIQRPPPARVPGDLPRADSRAAIRRPIPIAEFGISLPVTPAPLLRRCRSLLSRRPLSAIA